MSPAARLLVACMAWGFAVVASGQTSDARGTKPADRTVIAQEAPVLAPARPAEPTRRMALVVGNGAYRGVAPLRNARNDADDMCAALERLGFQTTCLRDVGTRSEFRRVLTQFASQVDSQTAVAFYYAGHGVQINGSNLLLPTAIAASSVRDLETGGMPLQEIFSSFEERKAALGVYILDACREDPVGPAAGPRVARGLARQEPPTNSVLVFSTAPGATASDGHGRNGLFTSHLLAEIEKPGPQIGEMFRNVARLVQLDARSRAGTDQVPYRSFSFSGTFCFAQCDDALIAEEVAQLRQHQASALQRIKDLESLNARLLDPSKGSGELATSASTSERENQIQLLKRQMADLQSKASQLESYRLKIAELERDARQRDQQLTESARKEEVRRSQPISVPIF